MDGGTHVGLFGAIGRETKGALRSLGYDLRRSKRFRRIGTMAVATMAGGVIAAGTLLQADQVPGIPALGGDDDPGIVGGWFGLGSDTSGQDAESSGSESPSPTGEAADPEAATSPAEVQARGGETSGAPGRPPGLVPIGDATSDPGEEEGGSTSPTREPTTEAPTTEVPTQEPTSEAPTEEPTSSPSLAPTSSPPNPTTGFVERAPRQGSAPVPRKGPVGG